MVRNYLLGAIATAMITGPGAETAIDRKKALTATFLWPVVVPLVIVSYAHEYGIFAENPAQ